MDLMVNMGFRNSMDLLKSSYSRVFLLRQIWIVKYSIKCSTADYKCLLFLPNQYEKCQYGRLFKENLETYKKKLFDGVFDNPYLM